MRNDRKGRVAKAAAHAQGCVRYANKFKQAKRRKKTIEDGLFR